MLNLKLEGVSNLKSTLEELSRVAKKKIAREAVVVGATPLVDAAQAAAERSKDTGNLKNSIGFRAVNFRNGNATAIIGPRRGFVVTDSKGRKRVANKYAHLIEFGHYTAATSGVTPAQLAKATKGKTRASKSNRLYEQAYVLPQPFMRPAFASANKDALNGVASALGQRVEAAAARLARRRLRKSNST